MPLSVVLADGDGVTSENVVPFAYGDMDNWIVREIHESGIIGGNTKWLYELGPSDTIVGNTAFRNMGGSPWATSNVMAKVAGVVAAAGATPLASTDETAVFFMARARAAPFKPAKSDAFGSRTICMPIIAQANKHRRKLTNCQQRYP